MQKYKQISTERVVKNNYWEYKLDKYTLPNGNESEYHYINSRGAAFVIPRLNVDTFIMVRQYRYLNQQNSLEFPGGGIQPGMSSLETARDELKQEAGVIAQNLTKIGQYNPFNGVTNEICHVYLATELTIGEQAPDDSEEIEIIEIKSDEIINKIQKGEIWDGMTLAAWSIFYFSGRFR